MTPVVSPSSILRKLRTYVLACQEDCLERGPLLLNGEKNLEDRFHLTESGLPFQDLSIYLDA